ncbi:hypothetical protein GVAV_003454 [Gurleya vavrai]
MKILKDNAIQASQYNEENKIQNKYTVDHTKKSHPISDNQNNSLDTNKNDNTFDKLLIDTYPSLEKILNDLKKTRSNKSIFDKNFVSDTINENHNIFSLNQEIQNNNQNKSFQNNPTINLQPNNNSQNTQPQNSGINRNNILTHNNTIIENDSNIQSSVSSNNETRNNLIRNNVNRNGNYNAGNETLNTENRNNHIFSRNTRNINTNNTTNVTRNTDNLYLRNRRTEPRNENENTNNVTRNTDNLFLRNRRTEPRNENENTSNVTRNADNLFLRNRRTEPRNENENINNVTRNTDNLFLRNRRTEPRNENENTNNTSNVTINTDNLFSRNRRTEPRNQNENTNNTSNFTRNNYNRNENSFVRNTSNINNSELPEPEPFARRRIGRNRYINNIRNHPNNNLNSSVDNYNAIDDIFYTNNIPSQNNNYLREGMSNNRTLSYNINNRSTDADDSQNVANSILDQLGVGEEMYDYFTSINSSFDARREREIRAMLTSMENVSSSQVDNLRINAGPFNFEEDGNTLTNEQIGIQNLAISLRNKELKKIFTLRYKNKKDKEKDEECVICFSKFCLNHILMKLNCNHYFHKSCLKPWLKISGVCPMCRKSVLEKKT